MAYKQSPFPYVKGTKKHTSALKGRFAQIGDVDPNKDELDSAMKAHKDGHAEMNSWKWQYSDGTTNTTEGQDEDKIYDSKGNHVGNWVKDKEGKYAKKMFKKGGAIHDFDNTIAKTK